MIKAEFFLKNEALVGFKISGHAGFDVSGYDIVCSAVTALVEMTANAITDIIKADASVSVSNDNNCTTLVLNDESRIDAINFLKALRLELEFLSQDYSKYLRISEIIAN